MIYKYNISATLIFHLTNENTIFLIINPKACTNVTVLSCDDAFPPTQKDGYDKASFGPQ